MTATIAGPQAAVPTADPGAATAPVTAPPAGKKSLVDRRNPVIDGYRGIAAIAVVFGHTVLINQLIFSVSPRNAIFSFLDSLPFFFAVSGLMNYRRFVIGALTGKLPHRRDVIFTRLWRILPVYFLIILIVWAMRFANSPADWSDLLLHVSFMQTWSSTYTFWLDGPSWFLANDMQFFLLTVVLAPFVSQLALRIPMTRFGTARRMAVMALFPLLLLAASCLDIYWTQLHNHDAAVWVRYTPIYTLGEYALGMVLAVIVFSPGVVKIRPRVAIAFTLLGWAGVACVNYFQWHKEWVYAYQYPLVACGVCLAVAGALMMSPTTWFSKLLGIKALQTVATVGLTILLVQEPLEIALEHWGFINVFDPIACWVSATLLAIVATIVAYVAMQVIEKPALTLRDKLQKMRAMETGRDRRHRGPIPRMLPDVNLELLSGDFMPVRDALGDRPLLVAFGEAGAGALAEQQFRISSGESRALHISPSLDRSARESERLGAHIALDPEGKLSQALNIPVALVEVGPDGLITSFQRSRREALGAWT